MLKWRNPTVKECIFVVVVFAIVTAMLIPTCDLRSKKTVNHSRVIKIIKKFKQDQMSYFNKFGKYSSYEEVKSSYPILGRNEYGYDFIYEADNTSFRIWAIPKNYGKDGDLSFYADNIKGFIYGADHQGEKADANDSKVDSLP